MAVKAKVKIETSKSNKLKSKAKGKKPVRKQIDQFLLGLQHSSLVKFSSKLKATEPSDLLMLVGRKVLEQAEVIRATIPDSSQVFETVREQAKKPFKAAARVARPLKARATLPGATRPIKKAKKKK